MSVLSFHRRSPGFSLILLLLLSACAGLPTSGGSTTPTPPAATHSALDPTLPPAIPTNISARSLIGPNLIANGDAEAGSGATYYSSIMAIPGWTRHGFFNVMEYQASGDYQSETSAGPSNRGKNFFFGGEEGNSDNTVTSGVQTIDVSVAASLLTTGQVGFTLSGWLGGLANQDDNARLTIQFVSSAGQVLGTASLGPVMAADRKNITSLLFRMTSGKVPASTSKIIVTLTMTKVSSINTNNDGSADDLSLILNL